MSPQWITVDHATRYSGGGFPLQIQNGAEFELRWVRRKKHLKIAFEKAENPKSRIEVLLLCDQYFFS